MGRWDKILEKLLPSMSTDMERAALRADPEKYQEYLNALTQKYGPKIQRAEQLGFDPKTWYHGTNLPIQDFKKEAQGLSTGAQSAKQGYFFAEDPSVASDYADLAQEQGIIQNKGNPTTKSRIASEHKKNMTPEQIQDLNLDLYSANERLKNWTKRQSEAKTPEELNLANQKISEETQFIKENDPKTNFIQRDPRVTQLRTQAELIEPKAIEIRNQMRQLKKVDPNYETSDIYNQLGDQLETLYKPTRGINDLETAGGQNVLPVHLRMPPDETHVKDYMGQGYRDTSYANEMAQAQKEGKSAALFKNTYDYAKMSNNPQQDIATVFNPNQIRSVNAAFDPRFKTSKDILAGLAGGAALGAAALMTPEEAQAAGLQTIMSKLGVGLEEAQKIKKLAVSNLPQGVFEDNLRALQQVRNYKEGATLPKLGQGMDYQAYLTPKSQVLKVPFNRTEITPEIQAAPALLQHFGLGPQTKSIQLGDKSYMVQDRVNPLDQISRRSSRHGGDARLEQLYKQLDQSYPPVDQDWTNMTPEQKTKLAEAQRPVDERRKELYQVQGIDPEQLALKDPASDYAKNIRSGNADAFDVEMLFEQDLKKQANDKLGKYIDPIDLHAGNIGLDKQRNPTVFDSSRFDNLHPEELTPELRQAILNSNIMTPEKKQLLKQSLERKTDPFLNKNVAGLAGATALGGLAGGTNQASAESVSPIPSINEGMDTLNKYVREPVAQATQKVSDAILSGTTPLQGAEKQQFMEQNSPIFGGAAQMVTDPMMYVPGGPELDMTMQFPKLKKYFQGNE